MNLSNYPVQAKDPKFKNFKTGAMAQQVIRNTGGFQQSANRFSGSTPELKKKTLSDSTTDIINITSNSMLQGSNPNVNAGA